MLALVGAPVDVRAASTPTDSPCLDTDWEQIEPVLDLYVAAWTTKGQSNDDIGKDITDFLARVKTGYEQHWPYVTSRDVFAPSNPAESDKAGKDRFEANLRAMLSDTKNLDGDTVKRHWKDVTVSIDKGSAKARCRYDASKKLVFVTVPWTFVGQLVKYAYDYSKYDSTSESNSLKAPQYELAQPFDMTKLAGESRLYLDTSDAAKFLVTKEAVDHKNPEELLKMVSDTGASTGPRPSKVPGATVYGKITLNGGVPPTGTTVECVHSAGAPYPYDATDAAGNYACPNVASGTVYLRASGSTSPACPNPVPSSGSVKCDANITGCGGSATVTMSFLVPWWVMSPRLRKRRCGQIV